MCHKNKKITINLCTRIKTNNRYIDRLFAQSNVDYSTWTGRIFSKVGEKLRFKRTLMHANIDKVGKLVAYHRRAAFRGLISSEDKRKLEIPFCRVSVSPAYLPDERHTSQTSSFISHWRISGDAFLYYYRGSDEASKLTQ